MKTGLLILTLLVAMSCTNRNQEGVNDTPGTGTASSTGTMDTTSAPGAMGSSTATGGAGSGTGASGAAGTP